MQGALPDSRVMRRAAPGAPTYETRAGVADAVAQFSTGASLRVDRSRERYYPGLASSSPPTLSLYDQALGVIGNARRVLDAGCGSGVGSQLLCQRVTEVIGIDKSQIAVNFARTMAPDAKLFVGDLALRLSIGSVDAAVVIDVLGHVAAPEKVLIALRGALPLGRKIYLAEMAAYPAQYLKTPARRAFSQKALASLLATCGYEVVSWERTDGPFLACVASPFSDPSWEALQRGLERASGGDTKTAAQDLAQARRTARQGIAVEAWLAEATLGLAERNGDRAILSFFKSRELAPEDPRPLTGLARISLAMGDLKEASDFASAAERLDPTDIDVACTLALVAERTRPHLAQGLWLTASNLAPDSLEVALHFAQAAAQGRECDRAVWALERVRSYGDDYGTALHLALASALLGAERRADALLEVQLAQKVSPDDPGVADLMAQLKS
ncbi:MAG TPA: methyltransferase domain-containing protein [Polyangiaceae bacterium]|jgi:SAM-dependent methyltransferase|nr:methyltransferase domain-containing protein [Polyangiaceae bacterium]